MSLRENFEKLSSDELLHKVANNLLTLEAESIAREVLTARGIVVPKDLQTTDEESKPPLISRVRALVIDCYKGNANLRDAYWSLGMLMFGIAVVSLILYSLTLNTFASNVFATVFGLLIIIGNPFHAYCVWKCRKNTNSSVWEHLAGMYSGLQLVFWCALLPFVTIASWLDK